jgi:D-alanyl-D-alanine carboxypeptidase
MDRPGSRLATILTVACATLAVGAPAAGAKAEMSAAPAKPPVTEGLQRRLEQVVAAGAPGAVALVRERGRTIRLASGYADKKRPSASC